MAGVGNTCIITPTVTGRIHFEMTMDGKSSNAAGNGLVQLYYGIGTAPVNGVPVTGTSIGTIKELNGNKAVPIALSFVVQGLTLGTPYWFDFGQSTTTPGAISFSNIDCSAFEI